MAILRLVPSSGAPLEIKGDAALVGREPGCDVVVSDGSVSRKHARLEKRAAGFAVIDQGSANGTFLDSQRVAEAALKSGQEIRFGAVTFRVDIEGEDDFAATMVASTSPDATVLTPTGMPSTAPLGVPTTPARAHERPTAPLPKAGPPPVARPTVPAPAPPRAAAHPPTTVPASGRERMGAPAAPVGQMAQAPVAGRKGKGPVFWIVTGCCGCLLIAVMLVAGIAGAAFWSTRAPAIVVQAQLVELRRGDLEAAYHRLSMDLQRQLPREEFERLVREHPGLSANKDATFWKRSVINDHAKLSGVLTSDAGQVETATFELVKEGNEWRVSGIRVGESPAE
jgi:pSer/pThr/pTyr-binding forkhead associated (FHA) protein